MAQRLSFEYTIFLFGLAMSSCAVAAPDEEAVNVDVADTSTDSEQDVVSTGDGLSDSTDDLDDIQDHDSDELPDAVAVDAPHDVAAADIVDVETADADVMEPVETGLGDASDGLTPCESDVDCLSGDCVLLPGTPVFGLCAVLCGDDRDCAEGFSCSLVANSGGDLQRVCFPTTFCLDPDGDLHGSGPGCLGTDCDEADDRRYRGASEFCDGIDNDCDDQVDETPIDDGTRCETGFQGGCALGIIGCIEGGLQCFPDAVPIPELCDGQDNDCNGIVDDALDSTRTWYRDADGDGFGDAAAALEACTAPEGYVAILGDCDDRSFAVRPGASEVCDGLDNDCDGRVDADPIRGTRYFRDADRDGFGGESRELCAASDGWVALGGDCDDANPEVAPWKTETCNGADDDCDGLTDETGAVGTIAWYRDDDGDGFGVAATEVLACTSPTGPWVRTAGDCAPSESGSFPGAVERCDGRDNNCDGTTETINACGGCEPLSPIPGTSCGTCGSGSWVCDGSETTRCEGDDGVAGLNACGGCTTLTRVPGTACGTCDSGTVSCVGNDATACDGDLGSAVRNACGGCASLVARPGDGCGRCGTWACSGTEVVACTEPPSCPENHVETVLVDSVTTNSARVIGRLVSIGIPAPIAVGVCQGPVPNPFWSAGSTTCQNLGAGLPTGEFEVWLTLLSPGVSWHVRAFATDGVRTTYGRNLVFTTLPLPPVPPAMVSASDGTSSDHVRVDWSAVAGATSYVVYRDGLPVGTTADRFFLDHGAAAGERPVFRAAALLASDGTVASGVQLSWTAAEVPAGRRSSYTVTAVNASGESVPGGADEGFRAGFPVTAYRINNGFSTTETANVTSWLDTSAPAGTLLPGTVTASDGVTNRGVHIQLQGAEESPGTALAYELWAVNAAGMSEISLQDDGFRGAGTLSWQWQRSAADSNAAFSTLPGLVMADVIDTTAPTHPFGRYYRAVVSSTSGNSSITNADRGFRAPTPWQLERRLRRSVGSPSQFGYAVSVDENRLVVGAPAADTLANAISVYSFGGTTWDLMAMGASTNTLNTLTGFSVSILGDRLVAGVPGHDFDSALSGIDNVGAVRRWLWNGLTWGNSSLGVKGTNYVEGARLGDRVAQSAEWFIAGAPFEGDRGSQSGSTLLWFWNGTDWTRWGTIMGDTITAGDQFGTSVAVSDRFVAVGAPNRDVVGIGLDIGAVFVAEFVPATAGWGRMTEIQAPDSVASLRLGAGGIAVDDRWLIVGARFAPSGTLATAGAVYVWEFVEGLWIYRQRLTAPDAAAGDQFGGDLALDGSTLVVGALFDDDRGIDSGSAYVFDLVDGQWTFGIKLTASDGAAGDEFGRSVDTDGGTIVVGAPKDDDLGRDVGAVYVYTR